MKTLMPEAMLATAAGTPALEAATPGDILPGVRTVDSIAGSALQLGPHGQAAWWERYCGDSEQQQ